MKFEILPVTPFQQNCSLLWCEATARAAIVDPGGDPDKILAAIAHREVRPEKILLTHAHIDHAGATADLADQLGLPIIGPHPGDKFWIDSLPDQGRMFQLPPARTFVPDRWLDHGDVVSVGEVELEVRHCPGHTAGHVIFYSRPDSLAVVGDVLFQGSIGRTDLPGGDFETLIGSIRDNLLSLDDEVSFIPGHGPMSTIGAERRTNPFLVAG